MPNHLIHESSPYLLQHAHNPVEWYAWKPVAFERAQKENKPVLVSIGYSTCHWCHVMERESFEDQDVAAFMNEHFINIKVDREERPDIDHIYMQVCQAINGNGGWPLHAFLLPDGRAFYAGTYYPPRPAHGRPSWMQLLHHLYHTYRDKKEVVTDQAERLMEILKSGETAFFEKKWNEPVGDDANFNRLPDQIFEKLKSQFDRLEGGFGGAPKFPSTMSLQFLLIYHHFTGNQEAYNHVMSSLDKMTMGGIFDHLGGGFARYATDRGWIVPHFEKMLYDNALLVSLLADAYGSSGKDEYRSAMEDTLGWVIREMRQEEGGFFSALDADSEGVEGKYYVWDKPEIEQILGDEAGLFCEFYQVTDSGNWEHRNILFQKERLSDFAKRRKVDSADLQSMLNRAKQKLLVERSKRIRPGLDDKILLDWNALICTAFAKAHKVTGQASYRRAAEDCLVFLLDKFSAGDDRFFHVYKNGRTQYDAFLDDYAFLVEAMLEVYSINFDEKLLARAKRLVDGVIEDFYDPTEKLFYFTSKRQPELVVRRKEIFDAATPSGNAIMVKNLTALAVLFDRPDFRELAAQLLQKVLPAVVTYPVSFSCWAQAILARVYPLSETVVIGEKAFEFAATILRRFLPNQVIMAGIHANENFPLLAGKEAGSGTLIYLCRDYACQRPVGSPEEFFTLMQGISQHFIDSQTRTDA